MLLKTIPLILIALINAAVGLTVLSRNVRKQMNFWFFCLTMATAAWAVSVTIFMTTNSVETTILSAKIFYVAALLIGVASVGFAQTFPVGRRITNTSFPWILSMCGVLSVWIFADSTFLFDRLVQHSWGKQIVLDPGAYVVYALYLLGLVVYVGILMFDKARHEKGVYRAQAALFLTGFALSAVFGLTTNLVLPGFGYYQYIWVGPIASIFYISAMAYGIIRHRLFDVRILVARTLGYALAVFILVSAYVVLAFAINTYALGEETATLEERLISAGLVVVLALTFSPLKRVLNKVTNRLFYRDAYDTTEFIDKLNHALVSSIELGVLLKNVGQHIATTLKSEYCTIVINSNHTHGQKVVSTSSKHFDDEVFTAIKRASRLDPSKVTNIDFTEVPDPQTQATLRANNVVVIGDIRYGIPKGGGINELGYLVLGSKKSGSPYNNQDIRTLEVVVNELVIAIQNALHFAEIEHLNATLQHRVEEATKRLRQTNTKLRTIDATKDDFISMSSHQLRTPLTSVKGYISMVLDEDAGKISSLQRKLLHQAYVSSQRMVYLISDLLNISRLRTGKFLIEPSNCNLVEVIQDEVDQLSETAKSRNLEIAVRIPDHFPTLYLDETKIRQVVMNFIDNAIYYTPSGGQITISLLDKAKSIEFTVEDDGMGVPKSEQHHLFTKFYRARNAKQARPDGTGLGLFMTRKIVTAQGGAIIFHSVEGKGSTFGFMFPKSVVTPPAKPIKK